MPGGLGETAQCANQPLLAWLRAAEPQVRRLGSVCSGALILAAAGLLRASRGQVAAIGSMAGWMPVLGRAGYCAAKSALGQAFEVLRAELARDGVGLLMVYPSFLDTPIDRNALGADGKPAGHARSTIGRIRGADWMAGEILKGLEQRRERLFPDRGSWLASLLWRLAPALYYRQMSRRFAAEMG
mgnify:CR=1 FL=1